MGVLASEGTPGVASDAENAFLVRGLSSEFMRKQNPDERLLILPQNAHRDTVVDMPSDVSMIVPHRYNLHA